MSKLTFIVCLLISVSSLAQDNELKIARLKYSGGGDWYANPTSLPNLIAFGNRALGAGLATNEEVVTAESDEIYNYPFIHMTGHGNVVFNDAEAENLRRYLLSGGFLHIDDNYGMDPFVRLVLAQVFPDKELIELPFDHPLYHQKYNFSQGLPKIHEHDGTAPKGYAILNEGRVLVYYTFECDLGDGWEDPEVHNDPEDIRLKALQMGSNLLEYAFTKN